MQKNILFFLFPIFLVLSLFSCSSQKNSFTNRLYHNTTARFNAYYYANEKILELEGKIREEYQEDYSQVLPVFYPIDSSTIEANEALLEEAREMASKAIDWHKISKWVDPSYFLIGKVDYYKGQFEEAQNTFKYLNVNSEQDEVRHEALIQLLKSFVDLGQFEDANFVIDYLSKETSISRENKKFLYKTLAYYYETRGETDMIVPSIFKALELSNDKAEISRMHFMLGQMYQNAGLDAFAYEYYQKALTGSPNYERTFFAQLYSQQVAELEKSKDLKRVRDYYDELYKDNKNVDFRDVILFEKGRFEKKQGNLEEAIRLYSLAVKEPGENERQKGYIYQELSEIYLHEKEDFLKTKYYLDSALEKFKETDRNYADLASKKEVFDQYAKNYELLTRNDSLIRLSRLSPEEQEKFVSNYLEKEEERLILEAELANKKENTGIFENLLAFGGAGGSATSSFYWDNPTAIQRGALEFNRVWGNRPLTDNWRRSNRSFQDNEASESFSPQIRETEEAPEDSLASTPISTLPDKASLLSQIPNEPETREMMEAEMEDAYFNLGKLLYFDLKQPEKAIGYLEKLIQEFPQTPKKPEAYYTLYLASQELNTNPQIYFELLNAEFPNSQFTKSINNPDQVSGSQANIESGENYKEAYVYFQNREYATARSIIRETLNRYPLTKNTDRLLLLDIMISGKLESLELYKERLQGYLQQAKDEKLLDFAEELLKAVSGDRENDIDNEPEESEDDAMSTEVNEEDPADSLSNSPYQENKGQTHIFILPMDADLAENVGDLTAALESFHAENYPNQRLRTGTIAISRELSILIISPFPNAAKSMEYKDAFLNSFNIDSLPEEIKNSSFVISIENFQQLNKRKDIDEYRSFYENAY
ncbi:type IX secretion system periplasmic lipoprotein PorW/SprE [Cyclobacterium plantarum]|uniref:Tetratricopeptide repeat protein n=1 Tax=Cyclobacterium plantarum TaxID=2716263 RepID=A0ABX0H0B6_9BACT|nr:tetratricopeptide repeat protein [Cyclobacterium plantarum]NHE55229.1 tetratricopeptide repeat protein [Cyclobacterium plantarum]